MTPQEKLLKVKETIQELETAINENKLSQAEWLCKFLATDFENFRWLIEKKQIFEND